MTTNKHRYEQLEKLGAGLFSKIYKVRDKEKHKMFALKRVNRGMAIGCRDFPEMNELPLLQEMNHINIVKLYDAWTEASEINLILNLMIVDLEVLIRCPQMTFSESDVRNIARMALSGMEYFHSLGIIHRDIKANNLLLDATGVLKIADFGAATRLVNNNNEMTPQAVSRWYRAPELCFGARRYDTGIDIWALACVLAELITRQPLFQGDTDMAQLRCIFNIMGYPKENNWPGLECLVVYAAFEPGLECLENYVAFEPGADSQRSLEDLFIDSSFDWLALLNCMLAPCPLLRISAAEALKHDYFTNNPSSPSESNQLVSRVTAALNSKPEAKRLIRREGDQLECGLVKRRSIITEGPRGGKLARKLTFG